MNNLREQIADAEKRIAQMRKEIAARILELPDNPAIKRLNDSPNCFVMQFKDLRDNWTPEFHDFKHQYRFIAAEIERRDISSVTPFLTQIMEKGWIYDSAKNKRMFHPDVIAHLKQMSGL